MLFERCQKLALMRPEERDVVEGESIHLKGK